MGATTIYNKTNQNLKKTGLFLGILVFIRTMPFYLWALEDFLRPLCTVLILGICLTNVSKAKWTMWIFLSIASAYIWATVFVDHSGVITTFNFLAFAFIPIIKQELVFETYKSFRKIFLIFVGLSIVNYLLVLIGFDSSVIVIEPLNKLKDYKYIMHPFLVTPTGFEFSRFHSIYDEPGFIGTLCGLMLVAERMNLQKRSNLILLFAGLLSLSFYFYVSIIFGVIFFSKKLKHKWVYIGLLVVFIISTYNNEFLYDTIWHRFEYDATEGKFVGDNRNGGGVEQVYETIVGTPLFFTGLGSAVAEDLMGGASLKLVVIKHGFIFVALNFIGYGLLSFRQISNKKDWAIFMLFFILTLYQRPGFYGTYSIFMYVMLIYSFGQTRNEKYE